MNDPAKATAAAQQSNQLQAEQYAAQQQAQAQQQLAAYLKANPNPASQWGPMQGPQMAGGVMTGTPGIGFGFQPPMGGGPNAAMMGGLRGALGLAQPGAQPFAQPPPGAPTQPGGPNIAANPGSQAAAQQRSPMAPWRQMRMAQ